MFKKYPSAVDKTKVGSYDALCKSGGGYFYDQVLEYRVWCHPEAGAPDEFDGEDYYYPFSNYKEALRFSKKTKGAEEPLVLIKQLEWVDEPEEGVFYHKKVERITEWLPKWLDRGKRRKGAIEDFINKK